MATAVRCFELKDYGGCSKQLSIGLPILKSIFKYFHDNLTDHNVNQLLWMAYVQGFHGWATGDPLQDGVSGGHSLVIRAVDSFLGIRPFPLLEELHIPLTQRNWLNSIREYDIRSAALDMGQSTIRTQLDEMVQQLRVSAPIPMKMSPFKT